jgi:hypothetical protein
MEDAMGKPLIWLMSLAQTRNSIFFSFYKQEETCLRPQAKAMDILKTAKKWTG